MEEPSAPSRRPVSRSELRRDDLVGGLAVVRVLGRGATAVVYEVRDARGQRFAAKVFHPQYGMRANEAIDRFRRSARVAARVESVHVQRVHRVGITDHGAPYMLMDYVAGVTLDAWLRRRLSPFAEVVEVARQLADGLSAVHRTGAIHRDVKPSNVVLSAGGTVRILDFGICKSIVEEAAAEEDEITQQDVVIGTPTYMSPEQVVNGRLDERSDLWAAGAVLYEMITGEPPFRGPSAPEVMAAVLRDPMLPPAVRRPDCPSDLERICIRALQRDPGARHPSADLLRDDLDQVAVRHGYPVGLAALPIAEIAAATAEVSGPIVVGDPRPTRRHRI